MRVNFEFVTCVGNFTIAFEISAFFLAAAYVIFCQHTVRDSLVRDLLVLENDAVIGFTQGRFAGGRVPARQLHGG